MRFTDGVLNLFLATAKWLNQGSQIRQNQGFWYSAMLRFCIIDLKFTDVVYCVCYFQQANRKDDNNVCCQKWFIKIQKAETRLIFFIAMLSRIENIICFKYEERKQHSDKWRELPATEFIPMIVTAKAPTYKGYMRRYSHWFWKRCLPPRVSNPVRWT